MKIVIATWFFIMSVMYFGLFVMKSGNRPQQPGTVKYFNNGDTLLPDYVCPDTLIVVNADGLNKGMALIEQGFIDASDYCIDSTLHMNCIIK